MKFVSFQIMLQKSQVFLKGVEYCGKHCDDNHSKRLCTELKIHLKLIKSALAFAFNFKKNPKN